ncbi:MAG: radical SAM protein [Spirochaetales bacterium]|nr:radical SAM protein [Spirochaetales bacterium]
MKSALRRANLSDSFVVGKYSFSPYMACQHGCVYCDGRAERYYVDGDFDRDIVVRGNLPDLLGREIPRLRERGFVSIGSGISDAYQPIEAHERIMAQCAGILATQDHPVTIMTKSALALRDIDLWAQVNARSRFIFVVSLTHAADETRKVWEPGASSVDDRLEALRRFKAAGCVTGVLAMPLLPGITDTSENLKTLYARLAEIDVDFIMPGGLTLRPGRQKEYFMRHLERHRPDLVDRYHDLYREDRVSGAPRASYTAELYPRLTAHNADFRLPWLVPHRVYRNHLQVYDEVNVLLHHMVELYEARGINTRPLKAALKRYLAWLETRKAQYNRHRSWRYEDLDAELTALCRTSPRPAGDGGTTANLTAVIGNGKLAAFVSEVVLERKVLDYVTLKLEGRKDESLTGETL